MSHVYSYGTVNINYLLQISCSTLEKLDAVHMVLRQADKVCVFTVQYQNVVIAMLQESIFSQKVQQCGKCHFLSLAISLDYTSFNTFYTECLLLHIV